MVRHLLTGDPGADGAPEAGPVAGGSAGPWRILLAEDHAVVRAGLRALLVEDPRCAVVAEAASPGQLLVAAADTHPDLVVLDITLGQDSGLDALPQLLAQSQPPRVLVLTMQGDPAFAREALRRGAHGYLLKEAAAQELLRAVEAVLAGHTYLDPTLGARMLCDPLADAAEGVTGREREVLRLLAHGYTSAQIAEELYLSVRTVEAHRAALRKRTGASSRADLVAAARRLGLMT